MNPWDQLSDWECAAVGCYEEATQVFTIKEDALQIRVRLLVCWWHAQEMGTAIRSALESMER